MSLYQSDKAIARGTKLLLTSVIFLLSLSLYQSDKAIARHCFTFFRHSYCSETERSTGKKKIKAAV